MFSYLKSNYLEGNTKSKIIKSYERLSQKLIIKNTSIKISFKRKTKLKLNFT